MSLRPVRSRRRRQSKYSRLRAQAEYKPWKGWNWNSTKKKGFELLGKKTFVIFLVGLALTIGFAAMYSNPNNPLFHSYAYGTGISITNVQPFFRETFPAGDMSDFVATNAVTVAQCFQNVPPACMEMRPINNTDGAIAISKTSFDIGTVGAHLLFMNPISCFAQGIPTTNTIWGMFLTTNNTLPGINNYNPRTDSSVVLLMEQQETGGSNSANHVYIQSKQNTPMIQAANAQGSGDLYLSTSATLETNICSTGALRENWNAVQLNFTGIPSQAFSELDSGVVGGLSSTNTITLAPLQFQGISYYLGMFESGCLTNCHIDFQSGLTNGNGLMVSRADPAPAQIKAQAPNVDTGGFFGPLIKALISLGVFIFNQILGFVAFLAPAINLALQVLEGFIATVLNAIGGLIGYPTAGTDLFAAINALIGFFGQASSIFGNIGPLFSRFVDANSAYFTWLPTALSIASTIASLAINSISFVLTIIQFTFKLVAGVYLILLLTLFLVYTGDDSLGGILGFLETAQWLILGPLGWLARILNFILDIVTSLIGLIPKPFIQMVAHAFPRIPIVETNARFVNPSFDLAAIRSGNMLSVWAWFIDFTFLAWYNGVTPALPGSLGNLLPGMPATTFAALRGFLPILEIFLIIISALAFIIWPVNQMLSMISLDLDVLDFEMSPGRKLSSGGGFAGVKVKKAKKRFGTKLAGKVEQTKREKKQPGVSETGESTVPPIIVQDLRQAPQARAPINVTPVAKQLEDKS